MSGAHRLKTGGLIDRSKPLSFRFDGKTYGGFAGDTLASALLANGVRLVGRSFKYHRPRGLLSAGVEEPNGIVELRSGGRREPNTRATMIELYEGLEAHSQNRWPSLRFDALSVNGLLSPVFAAGFYYKTFMWPASFWEKVYEPLIRRAAGLGRAAVSDDPDRYEKAYAFCDVLVIGAGPAGLSAALAAARSGARVILCEEDSAIGGKLLSETRRIGESGGADYADRTGLELAAMPNVRLMARTSVHGVYDHGVYAAVERVNDHVAVAPEFEPRQRSWTIVATRAILAAGAIERPLVFGDNDRPGVMLAGAARAYVNRFGAAPGSRAVIFSNNDEAGRTLADFLAAGMAVQAVVDPRAKADPALAEACAKAKVPYLRGVISRALGRMGVQGAEIITREGQERIVDCDLIAMSGGWTPTVHLTSHLGGKPRWDDSLAAFLPGSMPPGMEAVGACAGAFTNAEAMKGGALAGARAAEACGFSARLPDLPACEPETCDLEPLWRVREARGKSFVDFQNDVATTDIELSQREGFRAVEHLKRYTTLGMATDQGKTSNINAIGLMAELTSKSVSDTGTTRFRPPFAPVAVGAVGAPHKGREARPTRTTPGHEAAKDAGAVFIESGPWMRASYFPKTPQEGWLPACHREVLAVRNAAGFCDVSPLGKIEVIGPDAGLFLDRLYCNTMSTLAVGKARYGLMLREDGFVLDDGTVARFAEDRYFLTTTTANAAKVMFHMEYCLQALWPELDTTLVSVSEQWAQYAVAGPKARDVLRLLVDPAHDLSNEALPYMGAAQITVCGGVPARIYRISFSGELAYEVGVPARFGDAFARAVLDKGAAFGLLPYGLEALSVMRIEKGHVGGHEMNGQTTARDLGLAKMMSTKKDYVGRAMAQRPALLAPDRWGLVGVKPVDPKAALGSGAHLFVPGEKIAQETDLGHVTSVAQSPIIGSAIALALVKGGPSRTGQRLLAHDPLRGRDTEVEVVSPHFYDPQGERLRV